MTPNDSSLSLSPSLSRRPPVSKRQKVTPTGQYDYANKLKINISQTPPTHLLSPNHQLPSNDDQQQKTTTKIRSSTMC